MRTIRVSADVFAGIWKCQQDGELNEDVILARVLGVVTTKTAAKKEKQFDKVKYQRIYMRGRRAGMAGAPKDSNEDEYVRGYRAGQLLKQEERNGPRKASGTATRGQHAGRDSR